MCLPVIADRLTSVQDFSIVAAYSRAAITSNQMALSEGVNPSLAAVCRIFGSIESAPGMRSPVFSLFCGRWRRSIVG